MAVNVAPDLGERFTLYARGSVGFPCMRKDDHMQFGREVVQRQALLLSLHGNTCNGFAAQ